MKTDPYVYKGINTLMNTLNIKGNEQLDYVEKEITTIRLKEIARGILREGPYDVNHIKQFHRHIFGDLYPWAGEFRTINIVKNETVLNGYPLEYVDHQLIHSRLNEFLSMMNQYDWEASTLDEKAHTLTRVFSEIWYTHAFREGNTRTTLTFISEFCRYRGFTLRTSLLAKNAVYLRKALVASVFEDEELGQRRNYGYLEKIVKDALKS